MTTPLSSRRRSRAVGLTAAVAAVAVAAMAFAVGAPAAAATGRVSASEIAANTGYSGWHFEKGSATNTVAGLEVGAAGDTYVLNGAVAAGEPGLPTTSSALSDLITSASVVGTGAILLQVPYSVTDPAAATTIVHWGTLRTAAPVASGVAPTATTEFISSQNLPGIPKNTAAPLSTFIAELETLDATYDVRYSGYGFWASQQTPAAVVASITFGGASTSFGIPPLTVTPSTLTTTVTATEIRPDETSYPGWHEGKTGAAPVSVDADGLHLGGSTASQIINGLAPSQPVPTLADLVALVGTYGVDVASGAVHAQLPFFFGEGPGFTTLRTAAPIPTGGFTPALDQAWMSSRAIPATATTPAIAANTSVPLSTLLDALSAQGSVVALAFGVFADPAATPAVVRSVTFQGTKYVFGVAEVPSTDPSVPTTDPSVPTTDPSVPTTDPSAPTTDPSVPTTDPSAPTTDPSDPTTTPTSPTPLPGPSDSATATTPAASVTASTTSSAAALPETGSAGTSGMAAGAVVVLALGVVGVLAARRLRAGTSQ